MDAKWIFGIKSVFLLSVTLLLFNLSFITAKNPGVELMTTIVATSFSRQGLDDAKDFDEVRKKIKSSPDGKFKPIPNLEIYVSETDLNTRTPRELRMYIFRQIVEPAYDNGLEGVNILSHDPELVKKMKKEAGILTIISAKNHKTLSLFSFVFLVISLVSISLVAYFSKRFGRLFAPGFILFLASFLPAVFVSFINMAAKSHPLKTPSGEGLGASVSYALSNVLPLILPTVQKTYVYTLILGLLLMIAALSGRTISKHKKQLFDLK
ncbi:MAG: hypothetical protein UU65_C0001G0206 [candidate division CPR2 bacterium GW2011_GWC1_41_48]|uniref:Uncharacterized protein n=1 Tax=candidate division CPR2 bacterium GW2011_GWC1_41_48 TaxID=1618344 RepID=A0A0G0YJT9_UNCC2|nr:MAG: hypothetical protein UT47_C0001G0206 [candidate division CPR2 bacterium GW2011_GWC2_39_35]KKR28141.1 MAG: hypothetical protein UT60_C0027G0031 [candidate division CPR2 bacterium GW2011_GWD2_39_7]KKS09801.1 MAG: hypothetical protein UU65_C0001G0206 [candidate division CPR2 bacterium GW2011_GWC1_41_48]